MEAARLFAYGIDYESGMKSCLDNEDFYRKILAMFQQDSSFARGRAAYHAQNAKELFSCMHELKGISGNTGLMALYEATVPLVELLRHGDGVSEEAARCFAAVETAYGRACEGIALFLAES